MPVRVEYEYAVVRVLPCVEREEFINVGVILYCRKQRFIDFLFTINKEKLLSFNPELDVEQIHGHLLSFSNIAKGNAQGGEIGKKEAAERFRWLTASRSTLIQSSPVHIGLTKDATGTLSDLFQSLVL